jgi:putative flippase GtrA
MMEPMAMLHATRPVPMRFVLAGIVNTLVGLAVIYLAKFVFAVGDVPANLLGYGVGLACSFVLNRNWTFGHRGPIKPALARFMTVQGVAYCLNLATVVALLRSGLNGYLAQAGGVPVYVVAGYLGCRHWAFRNATAG